MPHTVEPDEMQTKLDLARAYIDMGDPDGSKTLLEEVLVGGNDEQKQEANSLLLNNRKGTTP